MTWLLFVQVHLPADVFTDGLGTGWCPGRRHTGLSGLPCDFTGLPQASWNQHVGETKPQSCQFSH